MTIVAPGEDGMGEDNRDTLSIAPDVRAYLQAARIPLRLGCATPSGWPIVLSLWYLYQDRRLYCATQQSAKVVHYLEQDARCAFEIASDDPPYCGVRGQARAVLDPQLGPPILKRLLSRYLGGSDNPLAQRLLSRSDSEVAIVIEPLNLFTWNFADRMQDSVTIEASKPCPE
jgi:nitroimidazol reductase NimA-like FMN-containing flavoprotein (pyridoxamine 5'-phosphate oxidase superfamily)